MLSIIKLNTPEDSAILHAKSEDVTAFDDQLKAFCTEIADAMFAAGNGVGLAAPQVGRNVNIFVMRPMSGIENNTQEYRVLINPKIIKQSEATSWEIEGCLSIPGIQGLVERHNEIVMQFQDIEGVSHEETFSGFEARICQHEFDHLIGQLFIYRAQRLVAKKKT